MAAGAKLAADPEHIPCNNDHAMSGSMITSVTHSAGLHLVIHPIANRALEESKLSLMRHSAFELQDTNRFS